MTEIKMPAAPRPRTGWAVQFATATLDGVKVRTRRYADGDAAREDFHLNSNAFRIVTQGWGTLAQARWDDEVRRHEMMAASRARLMAALADPTVEVRTYTLSRRAYVHVQGQGEVPIDDEITAALAARA